MTNSPQKKALLRPSVSNRLPIRIKTAPPITARCGPIRRSAIQPPSKANI
jgi:hypothetical protein